MRRALLTLLVALCALACQRRELTYNYTSPYCDVAIDLDWSALEEQPSGMSLYFYPHDGSQPTLKRSNDTESCVVSLKEGTYDILLFNLSTIEFGSLEFSGMESFESAMVMLTETKSDWYSKGDEVVSREPEELAVKTYSNLVVTSEMVDETTKLKSKLESKTSSKATAACELSFAPQLVISTAMVKIKLKGMNNLYTARGSISGMSAGYYFASQKTHSSRATHLLESWRAAYDEGSSVDGEISTTFATFGLPDTQIATRTESPDWSGSFFSEILLKDKTTKVEINTPITTDNLAYIEDEGTLTTHLNLELGTGVDSDPLEGNTTVLPDVGGGGGSGGGFTADVEDWGNREEILIEIK